jgi:hypothetical protein
MPDNGSPGKEPPAPANERPLALLLRKTKARPGSRDGTRTSGARTNYCIIDGDLDVGRIYKERIQGEWRWLWFQQTETGAATEQRKRHAGGSQGRLQTALRRGQGLAMTASTDIRARIVGEIYMALERLDADAELLSIVGSWRDTLSDEEVLRLLENYNATGRALHRSH